MSRFPSAGPILYHISAEADGAGCPVPCFARLVGRGVTWFQFRRKKPFPRRPDLSRAALFGGGTGEGIRLLWNAGPPGETPAGFDGLHLGAMGAGAAELRGALPAGSLLGMSVHDEKELDHALAAGADYVLASPVFPPRCKTGASRTLGLEGLRTLAARSPVPLFALGGIDARNAQSVLSCQIAGLAGITFFHAEAELEIILELCKGAGL